MPRAPCDARGFVWSDRYGTISFSEAAAPALEVAERGYHLYKMQRWLLEDQREGVLRFPYNQVFWFQHGAGEQVLGQLMVNEDLGRLIELERADVIVFPALWPETYCYTLSAAMASGLPIIAPALGAFPERLASYPNALILSWQSSAADWNDAILGFVTPKAIPVDA